MAFWKYFRKSLKFDRHFFIILGFDVLAYLIFMLILTLGTQLFLHESESLNLPENIYDMNEAQLELLANAIPQFYYFLLSIVVLGTALLIAVWSKSRAIIYRLAIGKRFNIKYISKASLLGLIWYGLFVILLIILSAVLVENAAITISAVLIILHTYFSIILFIKYAETGKISALKGIFHNSWSRLDLAFTFLITLVLFLVLIQLISILTTLAQLFSLIISIALYFVFVNWARLYLIQVYQKRG